MTALRVPVGITALQLRRDEFVQIERPRGVRVGVRRGTLWITIERDARDLMLAPGDVAELPDGSPALIGTTSADAALELCRLPRRARGERALAALGALYGRIGSALLAQLAGRRPVTAGRAAA